MKRLKRYEEIWSSSLIENAGNMPDVVFEFRKFPFLLTTRKLYCIYKIIPQKRFSISGKIGCHRQPVWQTDSKRRQKLNEKMKKIA